MTSPLTTMPQTGTVGGGGQDITAEFTVLSPAMQTAPVVFASPHSGRNYLDAFKAASRLDSVALRRSEDAFLDELYAIVPQFGAPLLLAHFPRAYVDPNREPWELDPKMFDEALPGYVNATSPRVRAGLGTVAKVVTDGADIYKGKLNFAEVHERVERCYFPYHKALEGLLADTKQRFGGYFLIDCHSMPSIGGPMDQDPGHDRVDMVLGDANGMACHSALTDLVRETLEGMNYRVVLNTPYAGGFTTRNYGKPLAHGHALQIEVNRALYMDEATITRNSGFSTLGRNLTRMIEVITAIDPAMLTQNSRGPL